MHNVSEMSRDREMLFEVVDGRPMPRLPRGVEVDGVTFLTLNQTASRFGSTTERWYTEWVSAFGHYLKDEPASAPPTPQQALLNIANRVRVLVDELEAASELLHGTNANSLDDASSDLRNALTQIVTAVIEEPPADGGSSELAAAIRHARHQPHVPIMEVWNRVGEIVASRKKRRRRKSAPASV
jgi:hypothetical protein